MAAAVGSSLAVLLSDPLGSRPGAPGKADASLPPAEAVPAPIAQGPDPVVEARAEAREELRRRAAATKVALFAAISQCRRSLTERERWRIAEAIQAEAERNGYDPMFVLAIIEVESTCLPTANGPRGAVGLIQIKPSTARAVAKELGVPWNGRTTLVEPKLNVRLGLTYLSQMLDRFKDPYVAIAAYNRGPGRVTRMSRQVAKQDRYVKKVLARYENLLDQHAVS